jgi:ferric-dicitrate binding protein FerR (iron transport regulator)
MKKENTHSNKMEDKERKTFDEFLSGQDQAVQKYWMEMNEIGRSEKADTDKAWDKLYGRLQAEKMIPGKKFLVTRSFRIAASIIIIMGLAFTGLYIGLTNTGRNSENIILTDAGQKNVRVDLPDGSTVFLNRNSSITYPDRFDSQSRTVKLEGEAYFDIESDSKRPFTVNAGDADVTVLGTSFNVNTGNNRVEVLVTSGEVLLKNHGGEESVKLQQGDLGLLSDDSASKSLNSDPNYLSWKTEILVFEGDSLGKVIRDLKRVHNINIETGNDEIRKLRVTSVFDNQSHETIIRIICTTFNLDYYKEGDKYILETK